MPSGINFKLFYASELSIIEICLQETILSYFMHSAELNIVEICLQESMLSYFMHLS
jgi:hypothetical protein